MTQDFIPRKFFLNTKKAPKGYSISIKMTFEGVATTVWGPLFCSTLREARELALPQLEFRRNAEREAQRYSLAHLRKAEFRVFDRKLHHRLGYTHSAETKAILSAKSKANAHNIPHPGRPTKVVVQARLEAEAKAAGVPVDMLIKLKKQKAKALDAARQMARNARAARMEEEIAFPKGGAK